MYKLDFEIGRRFGRWVVVGSRVVRGNRSFFPCRCECGNEVVVAGPNLMNGTSKSCGCTRVETTIKTHTTHGESKTSRLYDIWQAMIGRCERPKHASYENYGGRGIRVNKEWRESYVAFRDWALSNGYSDDLSIDRINNAGNYTPDNCRWSSRLVQANNKRNTVRLTAWGENKTLQEWIRDDRCVVTGSALEGRLLSGWDVERALTQVATVSRPRYITAFGETKNLAEWVRDERCEVPRHILDRRLIRGVPFTEAIKK